LRKYALDKSGLDSSFIDKVIEEKINEISRSKYHDFIPEALVEAILCSLTSSYQAELDLLYAV
jgi:hypothetical protein